MSGSLLAGTLSVAVFPLLSALAGATMAAGRAWAYNLAASRVGPLRVTLAPAARRHVA